MLFVLAAALSARAQIFSFGVKAGVPLANAQREYPYSGQVDTGRWTIGPTVEARLTPHLSLEVDALYRGFRSSSSGLLFGPTSVLFYYSNRSENKAWDFPLLVKYRFAAGRLRPFVDAGYSFTHQTTDYTSIVTCAATSQECLGQDYFHSTSLPSTATYSNVRRGPVAGAGLEFAWRKLKISPEVRYNRLNNPNTNQASILVGFTF